MVATSCLASQSASQMHHSQTPAPFGAGLIRINDTNVLAWRLLAMVHLSNCEADSQPCWALTPLFCSSGWLWTAHALACTNPQECVLSPHFSPHLGSPVVLRPEYCCQCEYSSQASLWSSPVLTKNTPPPFRADRCSCFGYRGV